MPGHPLIRTYLDELRSLPADAVDELTDGLTDTYDHHRARGLAPDDAARAAIAEFGTAAQVRTAFDAIAPGRRAARRLLAAGPLVGLCWATALISARAWTWPIPAWAPPLVGALLVTVIALLAAAARGRRLRHAALPGAGGVILLDVLVVIGALAAAPTLPWPLRLAILGSLTRAALTAQALPALRTH